jgi:hypothetical protein
MNQLVPVIADRVPSLIAAAASARVATKIGNHTFRASGINIRIVSARALESRSEL